MMGKSVLMTRKGFTLIELIVAMVIVGVAAAMAGVSFMSFTNIGSGKAAAVNAHMVQQRLELILAEKRKNGFPASGAGPDPCLVVTGIDGCSLTVSFENSSDNGDCNTGNTFDYCSVSVSVNGQNWEYIMRLYNY